MSLWDRLLEIIGSLVSPDWGGLVLLIPLGVAVVVGGYLLWVARRLATAGPEVTRPVPTAPSPAGIHMPGPSMAPFLAAGGTVAFVMSTLFIRVEHAAESPDSTTLVIDPFGVAALAAGALAMVVALLYWGREANREYDALEQPRALPATVHDGPPAGVHVPGPSFRPFLASIATAAMLLGLAIDPIVFIAGILMTAIGLLGWLNDARKEYREVVNADASGHLRNIPAPRFPTGTLVVFALLFVGSLLIAGGVIPPRSGTATGGDGASPGSATPAPGASGAPSAAPSAAPSGAPGGVVIRISAQGVAFDTKTLEVPADTPFRIEFANNDPGIPHNVAIHEGSPSGPAVWTGEVFNGVETRTYDVPALPAGAYGFLCTVHPNMTGTLTAR